MGAVIGELRLLACGLVVVDDEALLARVNDTPPLVWHHELVAP